MLSLGRCKAKAIGVAWTLESALNRLIEHDGIGLGGGVVRFLLETLWSVGQEHAGQRGTRAAGAVCVHGIGFSRPVVGNLNPRGIGIRTRQTGKVDPRPDAALDAERTGSLHAGKVADPQPVGEVGSA